MGFPVKDEGEGEGGGERGVHSRSFVICGPAFLILIQSRKSGPKKEPKPKLLSPDIFRLGRGLPCEGVGAKKFGMSLETRDIPEVPEKFENKKFVFNFRSLENVSYKNFG